MRVAASAEATRGLGEAAIRFGIPVGFGLLTCDTLEQALDRAGLKSGNKGFEASLSAVEMANLRATEKVTKGAKEERNSRASAKTGGQRQASKKKSRS